MLKWIFRRKDVSQNGLGVYISHEVKWSQCSYKFKNKQEPAWKYEIKIYFKDGSELYVDFSRTVDFDLVKKIRSSTYKELLKIIESFALYDVARYYY